MGLSVTGLSGNIRPVPIVFRCISCHCPSSRFDLSRCDPRGRGFVRSSAWIAYLPKLIRLAKIFLSFCLYGVYSGSFLVLVYVWLLYFSILSLLRNRTWEFLLIQLLANETIHNNVHVFTLNNRLNHGILWVRGNEYFLFLYMFRFSLGLVSPAHDPTSHNKWIGLSWVPYAILPNSLLGFVFNRILCIRRFPRSHRLWING